MPVIQNDGEANPRGGVVRGGAEMEQARKAAKVLRELVPSQKGPRGEQGLGSPVRVSQVVSGWFNKTRSGGQLTETT